MDNHQRMSRFNFVELPSAVRTAFVAFVEDESCFALPLISTGGVELEPLSPVLRREPSFQTDLNELDGILTLSNSCYIILRREESLTFITYVPYRAREDERTCVLENRHECVRRLGEEHFTASIICKEIGEITDVRSWEERDAEIRSQIAEGKSVNARDTSEHFEHENGGIQDVGYKKSKCRLCDRRMKNKISIKALDAFTKLDTRGTAVQISVDIITETLELNYIEEGMVPEDVASTLPKDKPSFTFYRHPVTELLYFIFHSPDSASVQERMNHTMAIPGLVNVHAQDQGVHVDQKIEIHDPEDLVFEAKDERIGKFRSMYLRNRFQGTESTYTNLEADKAFYDTVE